MRDSNDNPSPHTTPAARTLKYQLLLGSAGAAVPSQSPLYFIYTHNLFLRSDWQSDSTTTGKRLAYRRFCRFNPL